MFCTSGAFCGVLEDASSPSPRSFLPPLLQGRRKTTTFATSTTIAALVGGDLSEPSSSSDPENDDNDTREPSLKQQERQPDLTLLDDADKRIQLPYFEYGYRTEPMNWKELQKAVGSNQLGTLSRSVEMQMQYEIYKRDLLKTWRSVLDHVLVSKFGLEKRQQEHGGRYYAYPPLSELSSSLSAFQHDDDDDNYGNNMPRTLVVPNNFPYYTTPEIEHYVLWKLGGGGAAIDETDVAQAIGHLQTELGDVVDTLHWINPPHLQSLPEIDHAHILCLRNNNKKEQ